MWLHLLRTTGLLARIAAIGFGMLWVQRARLDYNSEGRYFDDHGGVVYDDGGVLFFGMLSLSTLVLAAILLGCVRSLARKKRARTWLHH